MIAIGVMPSGVLPPPARGRVGVGVLPRFGGEPTMARFDRTRAKTERARRLRREMTDVEKKLWRRLCADQLGVSFRRQHPIGDYVVDFYCAPAGLVVELDGDQHGTEEGLAHDARRTAFLSSKGLRVLRFWNHEARTNLDGVVETIWLAVQTVVSRGTPTPALSLAGGGSSQAIESRASSETSVLAQAATQSVSPSGADAQQLD